MVVVVVVVVVVLLLLLFVVVIALLFLAVVVIIIICVACGCGYYYYLLLLRPIWRHVWLVIGGQLHLLDAIGGQRRLLDDAKVDTHGAAMPVFQCPHVDPLVSVSRGLRRQVFPIRRPARLHQADPVAPYVASPLPGKTWPSGYGLL